MARRPQAGRRAGVSGPGRLRIVAGKWRRRLLPVAPLDGVRPTPERVRETLFNWLAPRIEGADCLDLCAGSGALGFEALSRGAARVTFVERSVAAVRALQRVRAVLDADTAEIVAADARRWLSGRPPRAYDIVFLDPPFAADLQAELCRLLASGGWLAGDARVYLEQDRHRPAPELPATWQVVRDKTAGNVRYTLLATSGRPGSPTAPPRSSP